MRGALLVAGTGSDAGKSTLVAGAVSRLIAGGPPPGLPSLLVSLNGVGLHS